jgi:hypothetical protein
VVFTYTASGGGGGSTAGNFLPFLTP